MKVTVHGIDEKDLFVHWIAPSYLVDVAYIEAVRDDGAVVLSLDPSLRGLPCESDQHWFREILVSILKDKGKQVGAVRIEFQ
jgi:hypothetical protein